MATKATEKAKVKRPVKETAEKTKPEPKKREPRAEPKFSVEEVWETGRSYASVARSALSDYAAEVKNFQDQIDADPRAYRDHATAVKFQQRRVDRITLSLQELEQGLKERKKPERKPRAEKPVRKTKPKAEEPETEEVEDEELEETEE